MRGQLGPLLQRFPLWIVIVPVAALDINNDALVAWLDVTGSSIFASSVIHVAPSPLFVGTVIYNEFLSGTEYVYSLAWLPSPYSTVVGYHLYRNSVLIATISASGPFYYLDRNRSVSIPDVYVLKSFNAAGTESIGRTVILP